MKALVVGYGSIGKCHARVLESLGLSVGIVSRQVIDREHVYSDVTVALNEYDPEYVVIANTTANHAETIELLAMSGYSGRVLVEKPLFAAARNIPANCFSAAFVGYNLRVHPLMHAVREFVEGKQAISVHAYVGQHLSDWRPETDYRGSYSASRDGGGGVLRDLSHEIDYLNWLFGSWIRLTALGGHFSSLEIDSDDTFSILMTLERAPVVSVSMNYVDVVHQRTLTVNLDEHTLVADFIAQTLCINSQIRKFEVSRDNIYEFEHRAVLDGRHDVLCSFTEGQAVVETIDAIEHAAAGGKWISR